MKKILISILISTTFLMVACDSGDAVDVQLQNNEINSTSESLDRNNEKSEELDNKDVVDKNSDSVEEKEGLNNKEINSSNSNSENESESLIIIQSYYIGYDKSKQDEVIKALSDKYKKEGINTIVIDGEESEYIQIVKTNKNVTNVTIHGLSEEFYDCDMNLDIYIEKYGDINSTILAKELSVNDVILLPCNVGEGIPQNAISWIESSGELKYKAIYYNGKGE